MIVIIDNYDSFTYNLFQYLGELGAEIKVFRNDKTTIQKIESLRPNRIVISPGPGRPEAAGISKEVVSKLGTKIPILGVCLGHQCIGEVFGGRISSAPVIMHGKTSQIYHTGETVFKNLPNPFEATRYHSLIIDRATLPDVLTITARTEDEIIMGVQHKVYPIWGVQFHPESVLTEPGKQLLQNFLNL